MAAGTVSAWRPSGTGTPCLAKSCLPWYSSRSTGVLGRRRSAPAAACAVLHRRVRLSEPCGAGRDQNVPLGIMPRPMALPKLKDITWVTTDCYGTLIDWEKGIVEAFRREADRDGFSFEEEPFMNRFYEVQAEIIRGSYELYAEVLRRAAVRTAKEIGWGLEPSRAQVLPDSVPRWLPFRESKAAMARLAKRYEVGIVSNIDDKLLGVSRRHLRTELDLVVTAQQVRSYKPDPAHFKECARRIGGKKGWLHIASGYETDVGPCLKMNVPVIWVNRKGEKLEGRKAPSATVKNLRDAAKRLGAGGGGHTRRSGGPGDGRAGARALRGRAPPHTPSPARRSLTWRAAQPDHHRRPEVRDHQPAPLPQPAPGDRDVAAEGAQLLRHRAQLATRPRVVRRPLRSCRSGPGRELAALHEPADL